MVASSKTKGGDVFIVGNSDKEWKVARYLHEWADIAAKMDTRGKSNRNAALRKALAEAEKDFEQKFGFARKHSVNIQAKASKNNACLQACDYFLWALQRNYETGESRFIELVWPKVGEIHDLDIVQDQRRGAFYTQKNPLVLGEDNDSA